MNSEVEVRGCRIRSGFKSDQYQLLEKIGEGGFGRIYKAQDRKSNQIVAIKFLLLSDDYDEEKRARYLERFERESLLCARLNHPNIVKLLDKGFSASNMVYAVYEFIEGYSLKEVLRSEKLDAVEIADIMAQVLDAMVHAHQQGVIHRDLKPANIMLMQFGAKKYVKILDFGIGALTKDARQVDYQTLTLTQETLGTPSYSAPEQLRGEIPTVASDLYVWGLVFIECLTRKPAITGSSMASIFHKQLASENIPLPVSIVGHPVSNLLRRVLQKNVKDRVSKAVDVYAELSRLNFSSLIIKDESTECDYMAGNGQTDVYDLTTIVSYDNAYTHLAERKQVCVLCLTINAIKRDSHLEREYVETFVRDLRNQCADLAVGYSGQVIGTLGSCLVVYFGYPVSTGNDGRLTARSALEIASLIRRRNSNVEDSHGFSIQYQMSIHTGQVTCYSDSLPEGEVISQAMYMLQYAKSNEILCSDAAESVLKNYIEFNKSDRRRSELGVDETYYLPVSGERRAEALGFIRANKVSAEMYGRESQLQLVINRLNNTDFGFAHIQGDAGVGKSRLAYEVRNRLSSARQYIEQCYPEQMFNGLFPILSLIKSIYFQNEKDINACRKAIEDGLLNGGQEQSVIFQVLIWLEIPLEESELQESLLAPLDEITLFNALAILLAGDSLNELELAGQVEPVLFLLEDLHWADEKTHSFLNYFLCNASSKSVRILTTSRASLEYARENDSEVDLAGLNGVSGKKLIRNLLGEGEVSTSLLEFIIARTDGVPLFIEEMVDMLLKKDYVRKINGVYDFLNGEKSHEVPSTILDVLHHKLDNLEQAKMTAQLASLMGREFDYAMLAHVSNKSDDSLQSDLELMVENEVVFRQRKVDGDRYIFKHVLIRDAAEESTSNSFRKANHQRFAEYFEKTQNLEYDNNLNSIIHHYEGCEDYQSALKYCRILIDKSLSKGAFQQAYEMSDKALSYASHLNLSASELVSIYSPMTTSAMMISGWASAEVERLVDETQKLMVQLKADEKSVEFSSYWAMAVYYEVRGQHLKAVEFIDLAYARSDDLADKSALLALKGHSLWAQGNHHLARQVIAESLSLYEKTDPRIHGARYGQDSKVYALSVLALIESDAGDIDRSEALSIESMDHAMQVESQHSLVLAKVYWCCCLYQVGIRDGFLTVLEDAKQICARSNLGAWDGIILILDGWFENNTEKAECGLKSMLQSGLTEMQGYWNAMIAETEIINGKTKEALIRIEQSLRDTIETKEYNFVSALENLKDRITRFKNAG